MDESVKTLVRKLQGTRATAKISEEDKQKLSAEGKEVNQISASQMGYDNRLENLQTNNAPDLDTAIQSQRRGLENINTDIS